MPASKLLDKLKNILMKGVNQAIKAGRIAEAIREEGAYRWVGIYSVDSERGLVTNIAWSGPSAPAYPTFPITKGLTSRAIAGKKTINVGDVTNDSGYLTAFASTRAEIIVPVLNNTGGRVIGTIDVESEHPNAFDSKAEALLEECARLLVDLWTAEK